MSKVEVAVRLRPFLPSEEQDDSISVSSAGILIQNPRDASQLLQFPLSSCYGQTATQEELFEQDVASLLDNAFDGLAVTVFAYGVTSSGKTHTMQGTKTDPGITPRVISALLSKRAAFGDRYRISLQWSYMEIYKDDCYDLLVPRTNPLPIRETDRGKIYVAQLTWKDLSLLEDFNVTFTKACKARSTAATHMNHSSSRSHAILSVAVVCKDSEARRTLKGRVNLVDLAGSENNKFAGNFNPDRLKEGAAINKSLSALGNVVHAINTSAPRIPYRDSKLTRILQDALGGDSIALLICTLAPGQKFVKDAMRTLEFARRSKEVVNRPRAAVSDYENEEHETTLQPPVVELDVAAPEEYGGSLPNQPIIIPPKIDLRTFGSRKRGRGPRRSLTTHTVLVQYPQPHARSNSESESEPLFLVASPEPEESLCLPDAPEPISLLWPESSSDPDPPFIPGSESSSIPDAPAPLLLSDADYASPCAATQNDIETESETEANSHFTIDGDETETVSSTSVDDDVETLSSASVDDERETLDGASMEPQPSSSLDDGWTEWDTDPDTDPDTTVTGTTTLTPRRVSRMARSPTPTHRPGLQTPTSAHSRTLTRSSSEIFSPPKVPSTTPTDCDVKGAVPASGEAPNADLWHLAIAMANVRHSDASPNPTDDPAAIDSITDSATDSMVVNAGESMGGSAQDLSDDGARGHQHLDEDLTLHDSNQQPNGAPYDEGPIMADDDFVDFDGPTLAGELLQDVEKQVAHALREQQRKHLAEVEQLKREHQVKEEASRKQKELLQRRFHQITQASAAGSGLTKMSKQARREAKNEDDYLSRVLDADGKEKLARAYVVRASSHQQRGEIELAVEMYKSALVFRSNATKLKALIDKLELSITSRSNQAGKDPSISRPRSVSPPAARLPKLEPHVKNKSKGSTKVISGAIAKGKRQRKDYDNDANDEIENVDTFSIATTPAKRNKESAPKTSTKKRSRSVAGDDDDDDFVAPSDMDMERGCSARRATRSKTLGPSSKRPRIAKGLAIAGASINGAVMEDESEDVNDRDQSMLDQTLHDGNGGVYDLERRPAGDLQVHAPSQPAPPQPQKRKKAGPPALSRAAARAAAMMEL